ncbi:MAG: ubiquinol-cytochrome c reductase iron-sulfur subunit [Dongiaceae bacterium]
MAHSAQASGHPGQQAAGHGAGETRRDFLYLTTISVAAAGIASVAWPLIDQMNPSADTLALSTTEVDLSKIEVGQSITVTWRGSPAFIRRRTAEEIKAAQDTPLDELKDPQPDSERVMAGKEEWLILVGVCTHLGCIPQGQNPGSNRGPYGGWLCSCHGSLYDTSGRIRQGPAPRNLEVPPYEFLPDSRVVIGQEPKGGQAVKA